MKLTTIFLSVTIALFLSACDSRPATVADDSAHTEAASGKCEISPPAQPLMCTMEWRPVCGCDGVTYSNVCSAKAAGVSEFTEGECRVERLD